MKTIQTLFFVIFTTFSIAACLTFDAKSSMLRNIEREKQIRMKFVHSYLIYLIRNNRTADVIDILHKLHQKHVRIRFQKCLRTMGSKDICDRTRPFYIWAQFLTNKIMEGMG